PCGGGWRVCRGRGEATATALEPAGCASRACRRRRAGPPQLLRSRPQTDGPATNAPAPASPRRVWRAVRGRPAVGLHGLLLAVAPPLAVAVERHLRSRRTAPLRPGVRAPWRLRARRRGAATGGRAGGGSAACHGVLQTSTQTRARALRAGGFLDHGDDAPREGRTGDDVRTRRARSSTKRWTGSATRGSQEHGEDSTGRRPRRQARDRSVARVLAPHVLDGLGREEIGRAHV